MTSVALGMPTFPVEVTNISQHGFWLLLGGEELFLPFAEFPWFKRTTVEKILHVELPSPNHLYWPELDIDLAVESIRHPEQFPLVNRVDAQSGSQEFLPPGPHTTHRAGPQWAVQRDGSLDYDE